MSSSRTPSVIARTRKGTIVAAASVLALLSASFGVWQYGLPLTDAVVEAPETTTGASSDAQQASATISASAASGSHEGIAVSGISQRDTERLRAFRATTAADALAHARQLPVDDAGRASLLLHITSICRRIEQSDRTAYISGATQQGSLGSLPDTAEQRRLLEAWWAVMVRYCAGVVSSQLRPEADQAIAARHARLEQIFSGRQTLDAAEFATLDPEELSLLLSGPDIATDPDMAREADGQKVVSALWSAFLTSPNPELALQAGDVLSRLRDGAFADTGKLIPEDPSDPLLWDGGTFHGNSRPGSREMKVWEAVVDVYVCRAWLVCGPNTARGLVRRPISELQLALGVEGYWRSMLSPLEWEAVEATMRRLEAERQAARTR